MGGGKLAKRGPESPKSKKESEEEKTGNQGRLPGKMLKNAVWSL